MTPHPLDAPAADEIEISLFGPGYGETVLVHVGGGRWFSVDSCLDSKSGRPAALSYLEAIGHPPATSLAFVVASHWHADHVRGLRELYAAASEAHFACASILTGDEFLGLGGLFSGPNRKIPFGPEELKGCLDDVMARMRQVQKPWLCTAAENKVLWRNNNLGLVLTALSPSDAMWLRCQQVMVEYMQKIKAGADDPGLMSKRPNDVAVALHLEIRGRHILLGSDLEEEGNPLIGWSAVLANYQGAPQFSGFKVAHHASHSGHHDDVWLRMLLPEPLAMITPFVLGRHRLPTVEDRQRVLGQTNRAFLTADPDQNISPKRHQVGKTQKLISATARNRRLAQGATGHIRWRAPLNDASAAGDVALFNGALHVSDIAGN